MMDLFLFGCYVENGTRKTRPYRLIKNPLKKADRCCHSKADSVFKLICTTVFEQNNDVKNVGDICALSIQRWDSLFTNAYTMLCYGIEAKRMHQVPSNLSNKYGEIGYLTYYDLVKKYLK